MLRRCAALGIGALLASAGSSWAQTSLQIPLQFDFLNPGAKSLALGGAFAGLADDATAALANPAGLTQLGASELSVELRAFRVRTPFLQGGRLSGTTTNEGVDTVQGPVFGESTGSHTGIGFRSGVYVSPSRRWVVAAYRHEFVRVDQSFVSQGVFQKAPEEFTSRRDTPQEGIRAVSITGYGASGSYKLSNRLAVGAGIVLYRFRLDSVFTRFDTVGFLGPVNRGFEFGRSSQEGDESSLAPTIGLLFGQQFPDPKASIVRRTRVGIVYRRGPSFGFETRDGNDPLRLGTFRVPDTVGLGISAHVRPELVVSAEVTRVLYSRLREDFVTDQALATGRAADFHIDDGTEVHVGVQYAFRRTRFVPRLRLGAWFDPDHSVRFRPQQASSTIFSRIFDERLAAALSQGEDQLHVTAGAGMTLARRVELNIGTDFTSSQHRVSTSLIVR